MMSFCGTLIGQKWHQPGVRYQHWCNIVGDNNLNSWTMLWEVYFNLDVCGLMSTEYFYSDVYGLMSTAYF